MKKALSIICFVISITMLFSACATANPEPAHYDRVSFDSTAELIEFIATNNSVKSSIQAAYPSELSRSKSNTISIFLPTEEPADSELSEIVFVGNNIYYNYNLNGYTPTKDEFADTEQNRTATNDDISVSSEPDEAANQIQKEIEETGQIPDDDKEIEYLQNSISIGWNYTGNGSNGLNDFVKANSDTVFEFKDYPNIYYSDVVYPNDNVLYGKMVYWVQDNYFFQAYIPLNELSSIMESKDSILNLAQPIQFSTSTFEAID